jgi:riboflavin kinase/FMN adenylyltransferase
MIINYEFKMFDKPVLTLGTFDGVHLGHQAIIAKVCEKAQAKNKKAVLVTYEPHPQLVVAPESAPPILTTLEEKLYFLENSGLDEVMVVKFNPELSFYSGAKFIEEVLVKKLNVGEVVIGWDHAFGQGRSGKKELLEESAKKFGFAVEIVPPITLNGERIKSTIIREEILKKDFNKGIEMLGHPFSLFGRKVKGEGKGRELGFPTINLKIEETHKLIPQTGVYTAKLVQAQKEFWGMAYVGFKPTFEGKQRSVEIHLFDYHKELEQGRIDLFLTKKTREDVKFESAEKLKQRLLQDKEEIKKFIN